MISPRTKQSKSTEYVSGKYKHGEYMVAKSADNAAQLETWIRQTRFKDFECPPYRRDNPGRARNNIYIFQCPGTPKWQVMKVSHISPRYKLARRIDLFLTSLYKDYAKVSFLGAQRFYACGLPVARPLAFWTFKEGLFNKRSYFLCEKVTGEQSVYAWLKKTQADSADKATPANEDIITIAAKMVAVARRIHDCGLRHNDLHTGNFFLHFPAERDLATAELCLLDYDKSSAAKIRLPWVKQFFDLSELRGLCIRGISDTQVLTMYLGRAPSTWHLRVMKFWDNGGFSVRKRLGVAGTKGGRHLKD